MRKMRILIPSAKAPFIFGGAEIHVANLQRQLAVRLVEAEVMQFPLKFDPEHLSDMMDYMIKLRFNRVHGIKIDLLIALQYPVYYIPHDNKVVWLIHQHRPVYDLYDNTQASASLRQLRQKCLTFDNKYMTSAKKIFTISHNVSQRLMQYNNISSIPLYHPPYGENEFYNEEPYDYVFYPSRIEHLKRQDLLIKAMARVRSPVKAIIAGDGGAQANAERLIAEYDLADRVKIIAFIPLHERALLYKLYARSLAVFFGPRQEDYGYITLEAMLSAKPVITCVDSGGPLEFVMDNETGFIVDANPESIAEKIDWLYWNKRLAKQMGMAGRERYLDMGISWDNVIGHLLNSQV